MVDRVITPYDNSVLFIVTSVIFCTKEPLCYTDIRSIFNPEERARQTVRTIESIRGRFSNAKILLIESGLRRDLPLDIINLVDHYIFMGSDILVRKAVDSKFKGLGEAISLIRAEPFLSQETIPFFIKLSGRYFLSDDFNFNCWNLQKFNAFIGVPHIISTRLYGFPTTEYFMWMQALKKSIPLLENGVSIEDALYRNINKANFNGLKKLGVGGLIGVDGFCINE
ncbi:MAG: hypothetical protein H6Q74_3058 [Firmicutes bacterium]|nr:hypothetical protein [Bacillota bacterium]